MDHRYFLEQALVEAIRAREEGQNPIGCVIADQDGHIVAWGRNRVGGLKGPTAQPEMLAIRSAVPRTSRLPQYAEIPIAFEVESVFHVHLIHGGLGGIRLREQRLVQPYTKDYDAYGDGPERWPRRFDIRNWGFFLAVQGTRAVGGATVAFNTPGVQMLGGRTDLAVLWDIRVHPDSRGRGIGAKPFSRAADWSRSRGCRQLRIETQNVNVPACRFYAGQGCQLGEINRCAYVGHPDMEHEAMLVWYLDL